MKLEEGDTIAVVAPSSGAAAMFPHIYGSGIAALKELGFKVKEFPAAKKDNDFLYHNPEFRAKDINAAFADKEVKAVVTTIGGDDSVRILPFLDAEIMRRNPKPILGYSDATTLHAYANQLGLVTLYSPSILAGLSQWRSLGKEFQDHIRTLLLGNPPAYEYMPYSFYSDGYPDWGDKSTVGQVKEKHENEGWKWLQGSSKVEGELFGGCIEVLEFMKGTEFWPSPEFWDGKILFLETSEEKPLPQQVKYMLRNYGSQGILNRIGALLIGRPRDYSEEEKGELEENVLDVVKTEFSSGIPVVMNMDFGHTDPQWILPLGIKAELDCDKKTFRLVEKIFKEK